MRTDQRYQQRRQLRLARRAARRLDRRPEREPEPASTDPVVRLNRTFRGINPMSRFERGIALERGQRWFMEQQWHPKSGPKGLSGSEKRRARKGGNPEGGPGGGGVQGAMRRLKESLQ